MLDPAEIRWVRMLRMHPCAVIPEDKREVVRLVITINPCQFCGNEKPLLRSVLRRRENPNGQVVTIDPGDGYGAPWDWRVPDFRHQFQVRCFKCGARGPYAFTPWVTKTEDECEDIYPDELDWGYKPDSKFAAKARYRAAKLWNERTSR